MRSGNASAMAVRYPCCYRECSRMIVRVTNSHVGELALAVSRHTRTGPLIFYGNKRSSACERVEHHCFRELHGCAIRKPEDSLIARKG